MSTVASICDWAIENISSLPNKTCWASCEKNMMLCSQQSTMEFLHPYDVSLELIHMLCACLCLSLRCHKRGMLRFISVNLPFYFFNCTYSNTWLAHSVYCTARCSAATRKRDEHVVWPRRFPSASIYRDPPSPACIRTPWRLWATSEAHMTEDDMKWKETDKKANQGQSWHRHGWDTVFPPSPS